jgi:hypothetical protein
MNAVIQKKKQELFLSKAATKHEAKHIYPLRPGTLQVQEYIAWIAVSK